MAFTVTVQSHHERVWEFLYGPGSPVLARARQYGERVHAAAVRRSPRDTGLLANSGTVSVGIAPGFVFSTIAFHTGYARWVMRGTGIYGPLGKPIKPVTARALRFEPGRAIGPLRRGARTPAPGDRGIVFAASVKGSPPNPFLEDALEEVMGGVAGARIRRFR